MLISLINTLMRLRIIVRVSYSSQDLNSQDILNLMKFISKRKDILDNK